MEQNVLAADATSSWRAINDFLASAASRGDSPALRIGGVSHSYAALKARAEAIAGAIWSARSEGEAAVAAVYADRSLDSYAGVLAALMLGYTYVPLNPKFPAARNRLIVNRSRAAVVLGSPSAEAALREVLVAEGAAARLLLCDALPAAQLPDGAARRDNVYVYTLFTSGSTGQPKGVSIRHSNLAAYLDAVWLVADYGPKDRISQNFDLTFDLSAHDMFVCWRAGAELVVPSVEDLERPADFVAANGITCWFSVPSLAQKVRMQKGISADKLGSLRLSLFCGEALRIDLAQDWAAATGQRVENWYGPTEATIACTRYVVAPRAEPVTGQFGLVPIGLPLPGMRTLILGEDGTEAAAGELLVTGPQVADGYVGDREKTDAAFVQPAGFAGRFYRTGDRVLMGADGQINFVDRLDNQIKIRGYRVELGEIEAVLSALVDGHQAVVVPLPPKSPTPTTLIGVVEGFDGKKAGLTAQMAERVPDYMVPTRIMSVKSFPKNASGKVDRGQLAERVMQRLGMGPAEAPATVVVDAGPKAAAPAPEAAKVKGGRRARRAAAELAAKATPVVVAPDPTPEDNEGLAKLVRAINPAITRQILSKADNLMDAGLDSMGFVELTVRMEAKYGLTLDQEIVAEMSEMSLSQLRQFVRKQQQKAKLKSLEPEKVDSKGVNKLHYRAMRTIDMLDKFPAFVDAAKVPLVLCVGSSGFMRGIGAQAIETAMGGTVKAANLGMGKLSALGITELCEYLRDTLKARNLRAAHAVIEMEIMQLSVLPPAGDIEVMDQYRAGNFDGVKRIYYDIDTVWEAPLGGTIANDPDHGRKTREADWERKRYLEIKSAFEGEVEFDPTQVAIWLRGIAALKEVCDTVLAVIHPIMADGVAANRAATAPNHITELLKSVADAGVQVMLDSDFDVATEDFRNINHMNHQRGRDKFSAQIAARLLAGR